MPLEFDHHAVERELREIAMLLGTRLNLVTLSYEYVLLNPEERGWRWMWIASAITPDEEELAEMHTVPNGAIRNLMQVVRDIAAQAIQPVEEEEEPEPVVEEMGEMVGESFTVAHEVGGEAYEAANRFAPVEDADALEEMLADKDDFSPDDMAPPPGGWEGKRPGGKIMPKPKPEPPTRFERLADDDD